MTYFHPLFFPINFPYVFAVSMKFPFNFLVVYHLKECLTQVRTHQNPKKHQTNTEKLAILFLQQIIILVS